MILLCAGKRAESCSNALATSPILYDACLPVGRRRRVMGYQPVLCPNLPVRAFNRHGLCSFLAFNGGGAIGHAVRGV